MQKLGVTKSYAATQNDVERVKQAAEKRQGEIAELRGCLIQVGDNLDLIKVNKRERGGKKNWEMHNFNRYITQARVSPPAELNDAPSRTVTDFPPSTYYHTQEDISKLKGYFAAVVFDTVVEHLPFFSGKFSKGALEPDVAYQRQVSGKSVHFQLPMLFNSESNYADIKCILEDDLVREIEDQNPKKSGH